MEPCDGLMMAMKPYDGHEKDRSTPLHRYLTQLVSNFWPWLDWNQIFGEGFMMAVKSIIIWLDLLLCAMIRLEWCQIFGFGKGFMMPVKSIIIWLDLLLYVTIWLEWCQIFGLDEGFMMEVKSIII